MDFLDNQLLEDTGTGVQLMDMLSRNLAGIINSLAFLGVAFVVVWMGVRPLVRSINGAGIIGDTSAESVGLELPDFAPGASAEGGALMEGFGSDFGFDSTEDLLSLGDDDGNFNRRVKEGPERKLARMVEINEERAAKILRKWAVDSAAA
jgi:flagellar M-ring protein FliF